MHELKTEEDVWKYSTILKQNFCVVSNWISCAQIFQTCSCYFIILSLVVKDNGEMDFAVFHRKFEMKINFP